jgi:hypothetical protein
MGLGSNYSPIPRKCGPLGAENTDCFPYVYKLKSAHTWKQTQRLEKLHTNGGGGYLRHAVAKIMAGDTSVLVHH